MYIQSDVCQPHTVSRWNRDDFCIECSFYWPTWTNLKIQNIELKFWYRIFKDQLHCDNNQFYPAQGVKYFVDYAGVKLAQNSKTMISRFVVVLEVYSYWPDKSISLQVLRSVDTGLSSYYSTVNFPRIYCISTIML